MLYQTSAFSSPISHYNHFSSKFQIQNRTDSSSYYSNSQLNTNLIGGAGNYGGTSSSSVNKNNGNSGGAILLHQGQYNSLRSGFGSNNSTIHGNVNILLGGAMLSVVITILCIACYCCHRNIKKRTESAYRQRWLENDDNMEIYSVEQCYESSGLFMTSNDNIPTLSHEPPPPYDAVILNEIANRSSPPPGYRSTNSINDNTNEFLPDISINKQYNNNYCEDECCTSPTNNNRMSRNSQSACSLERAHNPHCMRKDEIHNTSSSSNQNSLYFDNNNNNYNSNNVTGNVTAAIYHGQQQFIQNKNINNNSCDDRTLYSKLKSNSSSNDSDLDILVNAIQQQQNDSSLSEYNSDISPPVSFSMPSTSYCSRHQFNNEIENTNRQITNNNNNDLNKLCSIENNVMDLLIHVEQQDDTNNNNNDENLSAEINSTENNNNNCLNDESNNNNSNSSNNVNLEIFDENGIVRLDMSQIIDTTGLPTYEAALKLDTSGYV